MTQIFECPSCGGPLDLPGDGSPTIRCPYCGRNVILPDELRGGKPAEIRSPVENAGGELLNEIDRLIASGKKIAAIQQYRGATGSTLREARDFVERREAGEDLEDSSSVEKMASAGESGTGSVYPGSTRRSCPVFAFVAIVLAVVVFSSLLTFTGPAGRG